MNKYDLIAWAKSKKKGYWIFLGFIAFFIILAIVCALIAMHLCGYSLASWINEFYPILVIIGASILVIGAGIGLMKMRK